MSTRKDIISNIQTTLQAITILAGYSCDVGEVTVVKQFQNLPEDGNFPKIQIKDESETTRPRIGNNIYDYFWMIDLRLSHKGDDSRDVIDGLIQDTKKAMLNDISIYRGGNAWNTEHSGTGTVEDTFVDDRQASFVIMTFAVHYREIY